MHILILKFFYFLRFIHFFLVFFIPRGTQISQFDKKFIKQYVDFYKVSNLKKKLQKY